MPDKKRIEIEEAVKRFLAGVKNPDVERCFVPSSTIVSVYDDLNRVKENYTLKRETEALSAMDVTISNWDIAKTSAEVPEEKAKNIISLLDTVRDSVETLQPVDKVTKRIGDLQGELLKLAFVDFADCLLGE